MRYLSIFAFSLFVQVALSAAAGRPQAAPAEANVRATPAYSDDGNPCTQDEDCDAGGCCVWPAASSSSTKNPKSSRDMNTAEAEDAALEERAVKAKAKGTCRANASYRQPCSKKSMHNKGLAKGQEGYVAACPCNSDYLICVPHQYDPKLDDYRCEANG